MKIDRNVANERGFIGVAYALMIFGLLAFTGLAVDVGYLQWSKRRAQSAADAAAMGALRELEAGRLDNLTLAGRNDASYNGFTNGVSSTTVSINNPPLFGNHAGSARAVEAIVQRSVPTYFMMLFGRNSVPISARAVGHTTTANGSIGGCVYALNLHAKSSFNINGTTIDMRSSCSTVVNSDDEDAFMMGSAASYRLYNGAQVAVKGGWEFNGQSQLLDMTKDLPNGRQTWPTNNGYFYDPLAKVEVPLQSTIPDSTVRVPNGGNFDKNNVPANNMIRSGIYCGGITIGDTNGVTFIMNGVYILAGGGLTINSDARVASGTDGVFIYNTSGGAGWGCGGNAFGPVTINGNAQVSLKAPTTDSRWIGVLMFQDRNIYDSRYNKVTGTASSTFDGALYFRNSPLLFAGSNTTNGYLVLVADTISINGTTTLGNNYTGLANPNPFAPFSTGGGLAE